MTVKKAKVIRIILLIIACVSFLYGLALSERADTERAHSVKKVLVQVQSKQVYYNAEERGYSNGAYHIVLSYSVQNDTEVPINSLELETYVYNNAGKQLGTVKTSFSDINLQPGHDTEIKADFADGVPVSDVFFIAFYENELSDFQIENKVLSVGFQDGSWHFG